MKLRNDSGDVATVMVGALFLAATVLSGTTLRGVVINEVHYHPSDLNVLEFVELYNPGAEEVSLEGWGFSAGVDFHFPEGASIPPRGYVVVARYRVLLLQRYALDPAAVFGDFGGGLDNDGERLALVDDAGSPVDEVRFDDDGLWDSGADGFGASLQRFCADFPGTVAANWKGTLDASPTPLAANVSTACPPPIVPPPPVTINEIYYHPLFDRDTREEFVELRNNTEEALNLKGYSFIDGLTFTFEDDVILEPGGMVVVARDREYATESMGVPNAVGNFEGQLSNRGERLTLADSTGQAIDSVRYADSGDWPVAPDGLGFSLEKIVPTALSDDPASWQTASFGDLSAWRSVTVSGTATHGTRFYFYLDAVGETIIDNIFLEDTNNPGVNLIVNGGFDEGVDPWTIVGNHEGSVWEETGGPDGSGAIRMVSGGRGDGLRNGLQVPLTAELERNGPVYNLTFDYRYLSGSEGLTVRISGSSTTRGLYWKYGVGAAKSPGVENSVLSDHRPPFVSEVRRSLRQPTSEDVVWITARVRGDASVASAQLTYQVDNGPEETVDLMDDGFSDDGAAGDGIYGAPIASQPHNSIVAFRITARDEHGALTLSPPAEDPSGVHGYYVNDYRPESKLPIYTVLYRHNSGGNVKSLLVGLPRTCNPAGYQPCSFAYEGDLYPNIAIRRRGGSVCGATKPFMKLKFNRGRLFQGQRKINLQSLWTDKSLIREHMAWRTFGEMGFPTNRHTFIRLHANGQYFGLYADLEHNDERFVERVGLDPTANLYKSTASREEADKRVGNGYEKETNEHTDDADLRDFLTSMHATPRAQLVDFFSRRVDQDGMIDYQLVQTLTNNSDYPHKNHYLYHDPSSDRWVPLAWDMDLVYGKRWDGNNSGVYHDRMHTPGNNPWHTTSVDGGLGNHLLDKFFSQSGTWYRRAYVSRLWDALQEKYTEEFFTQRIEELKELLFDEQAEDIGFWGRTPPSADDRAAPADFLSNLDRIMHHVRTRRSYLLSYLKNSPTARFEGHDRLKITELHYNPEGAEEDLEFIELWNNTGASLDISGWSIEGIGFVFPEGAQVAENAVFVVAKNPDLFRSFYGDGSDGLTIFGPYEGNLANDGEMVRVKDAGPGYPATVDSVPYGSRGDWPWRANGLGFSIELTAVSENRDNDVGIYWKASELSGGTPGVVPGVNTAPDNYFTRGDVDGSGSRGLADAIKILIHIFRDSNTLSCRAAIDVDASGTLGPGDAILLLRYVYLGDVSLTSPGAGECAPVRPEDCEQSVCAP